MELRHLRYFIAVAEELHFSKAAERLNISQPPLSYQIAQLEEKVGAKLLNRTKRAVELTEAGKYFLENTYHLFNMLERTCEETRRIAQGEAGRLIIGFSGSWSSKLLKFLRYYRSKYPNIKVLLQQSSTSDQVESLHKKQIDVGILAPPIDSTLLNLCTIHRVPFYAALPLAHPLAQKKSPLSLSELKDEPFIMSPRKIGPGYYDTIISMCHQAGFSPHIIQEAEGVFTILTLVSAEIGVSIVSKLALEHPKEGVVFRELKDNSIMMNLSLTWRKNGESPIVKAFVDTFDEFFEHHDLKNNDDFS